MANPGPNTGGSQFFINLVDNSIRPTVDTNYPVFGNVIDGVDNVDANRKGTNVRFNNGPPIAKHYDHSC